MSNRPLAAGSFLALVMLAMPALSHAQAAGQSEPLTLQEAVKVALEKNPQLKIALADTKVASEGIKEARSVLLPHVRVSETATRSNDPVYVFGSKLRQRRFTADDFALNVLNTPTPYGNFATQLGGTWNLFDSTASWRSVNRAKKIQEAANNRLARADQEIIYRAVDSYYGVLLAEKQLEVAEQSMKTADAILERSKNRYESGVVVESDYLSAQVRLAERKQELIRAKNNLSFAQAQLNTVLGLPADRVFAVSDSLAERNLPVVSLQEAEKNAMELRPDLKSIRSEEAAQKESVSIAKAAFGPRVNAFADWEADNPTFVAGGGGNNWTAGIEVRFDLFQGGAKKAQLAQERARQEKIAAVKQVASDSIRLEVQRAYYDVDAAQRQIEVARTAIAEAKESLRINQNRYDSGLSTITDLLGAEEATRRSEADYWEALCRYYTSYANLELNSGTLNAQSPVVTP